MFVVAALTGARISELCGLTWADVRIDHMDEAEIEFRWQVGRHGRLLGREAAALSALRAHRALQVS